ncbi:MAG: hypothetical protein ACREHG_05465 [Candidatus Saccharimonadales bacterium]
MNSPASFHPDLTEDRLNVIADILISTRNETVDLFDPDAGDTNWDLGCRVYGRSCTRIIRAGPKYDWLNVSDTTLHLVFNIGQVPIRFYTGSSDDPTARTMERSFPELQQLSLAFPKVTELLTWRFAVEAEADGKAFRVVFAGFTSAEEIECEWIRNAHESTGHTVDRGSHAPEDGVELPLPQVAIPHEKAHQTGKTG